MKVEHSGEVGNIYPQGSSRELPKSRGICLIHRFHKESNLDILSSRIASGFARIMDCVTL